MSRNAPLAEFVTTAGVTFRVIREDWSNHKDPTYPAVLERYDGERWNEVDRWDARDYEADEQDESNTIHKKSDETLVDEAVDRIETKSMFEEDGGVAEVSRRF